MMGIVRLEPSQPVLSIVNVPPPKSSSRSLLARARAATSAMARLRPAIDSPSTSRMTGTIRPSSTATATPTWIAPLGEQAAVGPVGVELGLPPEGLGAGLDHERDVAQRQALAGLEVALGRLAQPDEVRRVDLHRNVGVGHGQRPGHLRRDALAHLGHRDEDFVGALREGDRGRWPGRGVRAGAAAAPDGDAAGARSPGRLRPLLLRRPGPRPAGRSGPTRHDR